VVFHLASLAAYACAFALYLKPEWSGIAGPWQRIAFVGAAAIMLGWISGIDVGVNYHNHVHRSIFTVAWLNRWFGRLWTISGGWPAFFWSHAHLTVHHTGLLGERDWTLPRRRPDGTEESLYRYSLLHWPWRYAAALWRDFRSPRHAGRRREALAELALFVPLWSLPFLIDPWMGVGLWLLPQVLANVAVMGPGMYAQHSGCVAPSAERPHAHSNTFLNRFFNLTMFNIGFHIEHHERPGTHWTDLPGLHERMKSELIAQGAHVLPLGYYRAGRLLCDEKREEFERCHPDYANADDLSETHAAARAR
jgi:fatty acid desaturase